MLEWMNDYQAWLWSIGGASVAIFIASLFIIPALVVRMPEDYFMHEERPASRWARQRALVRTFIVVGKNALGVVLMLAGVAMLVLPGQGLLTILVGFMLIDFPAKYHLEKWLVARRFIHRPINWLRRRAKRPPLLVPRKAMVRAA